MENEVRFRILIVDDEASNLHILNQILKERYTVYAARTGEAALRSALNKRPDLILLDVILPDISGYDVLAELKASEATRHIPVILISGLSNAEHAHKGMSLGAADYITKPFGIQILKEKVEANLPPDRG